MSTWHWVNQKTDVFTDYFHVVFFTLLHSSNYQEKMISFKPWFSLEICDKSQFQLLKPQSLGSQFYIF